jgi:hypothetical protein
MALDNPTPFAKSVENVEELEKDILMVYQIGYSYYALAKHYFFTNDSYPFPEHNCGPAGRSAVINLWIQ